MPRLLIIDDDPDILYTNKTYLEGHGYAVDTAACGADALELLRANRYSCILLDVLLPDLNGIELCREIRTLTSSPILFLSCLDDEEDKVRGLLAGGIDYITKPYGLKELEARIRGQVLRQDAAGLVIDERLHSLVAGSQSVSLSQKEFALLRFFMCRPQEVVSATDIYRSMWGEGQSCTTNTVAVHIRRLREKLQNVNDRIGWIETIRGKGYRWKPNGEDRAAQ